MISEDCDRSSAAFRAPADYEEDFETLTLSKPTRCATMCLFGCITVFGCRTSLVSRLAFYPPKPASYTIEGDKIFIPDLSRTRVTNNNRCSVNGANGDVRNKSGHTDGGNTRDGSESVQSILERNNLLEKLLVCSIPRRRKKRLAALLIYQGTTSMDIGQIQSGKATDDFKNTMTSRPLIIFSHGNSTDIGYMFGIHYRLAYRCRVNVLSYDYSGYGQSDGKATEKALYDDIKAVWKYAVNVLGVPPHKIVLYGHSVGSGPSCDLAAKGSKYPVGGVILQSSIASGLRLFISGIEKAPWFDAFRNVEKLRKVYDTPILVIHGQMDRQVPFGHSLQLELATKSADQVYTDKQIKKKKIKKLPAGEDGSKINEEFQFGDVDTVAFVNSQRVHTWWIPNADHNDIEQKAGDIYYTRISEFLSFCQSWQNSKH